jgi:hypothetical protein
MKLAIAFVLLASPLAAQEKSSRDGAAAGTYATAVELGENSCGTVTVQPLPTVVTHRTGDSLFTMVHGPLTHRGVLRPNGTFLTTPLVLGAAPGAVTKVQVAGRFTVSGFTASVAVEESGPRTCSYIVYWTGTRQGAMTRP